VPGARDVRGELVLGLEETDAERDEGWASLTSPVEPPNENPESSVGAVIGLHPVVPVELTISWRQHLGLDVLTGEIISPRRHGCLTTHPHLRCSAEPAPVSKHDPPATTEPVPL
jgi:hypothetical protein